MLKFDRQGLVPAVIQDATTEEVLMVAFMNEEALQKTYETGQTHFFSRSRNTIWHKGEQSGNVQEVREIFMNCEENSLLIKVIQQGGAACHTGYRTCYHRRLAADGTVELVAQERVFDPAAVYGSPKERPATPVPEGATTLEASMRKLYAVYLSLKDHDLREQSNTSRLLHAYDQEYLVSRLADELQELADVQTGVHLHTGRSDDTILEGSQVGYWLFLVAAGSNTAYDRFLPHRALLDGYEAQYSEAEVHVVLQECLRLAAMNDATHRCQGLQYGFAFIGWACAQAGVSPLAPTDYDVDQMRRKGLLH